MQELRILNNVNIVQHLCYVQLHRVAHERASTCRDMWDRARVWLAMDSYHSSSYIIHVTCVWLQTQTESYGIEYRQRFTATQLHIHQTHLTTWYVLRPLNLNHHIFLGIVTCVLSLRVFGMRNTPTVLYKTFFGFIRKCFLRLLDALLFKLLV